MIYLDADGADVDERYAVLHRLGLRRFLNLDRFDHPRLDVLISIWFWDELADTEPIIAVRRTRRLGRHGRSVRRLARPILPQRLPPAPEMDQADGRRGRRFWRRARGRGKETAQVRPRQIWERQGRAQEGQGIR